jgi:hypothetical protein
MMFESMKRLAPKVVLAKMRARAKVHGGAALATTYQGAKVKYASLPVKDC